MGKLRDEVTLTMDREEAYQVFAAIAVARYRLRHFAETERQTVTGRDDSVWHDQLVAEEAILATVHARLEGAMGE